MSTTIKKFDKAVITGLIEKIKSASKKRTAKSEIKLSLKENNIIKAINPEFSHDLLGDWNGYGYEKLGKHLLAKNFKETLKTLKKMLKSSEVKKEKKEKTPEEKIQAWATRLAKLTGISIEEAMIIAEEKIDFKLDRLEAQINSDYSGWKTPAWLKKAERDYDRVSDDNSKALDRITDEGHARAILIASSRHRETNYEDKLEEAKELVRSGQLDRVDVQEYARKEMSY